MDIAREAEGIIRLALAEDLGVEGDVTTKACVPEEAQGSGQILARQPLTLAGGPVAAKVFELVGGVRYSPLAKDGEHASKGQPVARLEGRLSSILTGERTALNFMCHLSGVATLTSRLFELAKPFGVEILDTRKTMPGMRALEKYAVRMGGGTNHRCGLFDGVIIKDNHIAAAGGVGLAVRRLRNALGERFKVEVEAASLAEVREALDAGADAIMLDNMAPGVVSKAVAMVAGRARTEVSGGITPDNLGDYAAMKPDSISLGFLTHSAPSADLSLELD